MTVFCKGIRRIGERHARTKEVTAQVGDRKDHSGAVRAKIWRLATSNRTTVAKILPYLGTQTGYLGSYHFSIAYAFTEYLGSYQKRSVIQAVGIRCSRA